MGLLGPGPMTTSSSQVSLPFHMLFRPSDATPPGPHTLVSVSSPQGLDTAR